MLKSLFNSQISLLNRSINHQICTKPSFYPLSTWRHFSTKPSPVNPSISQTTHTRITGRKKKTPWTFTECQRLKDLMEEYQKTKTPPNWSLISFKHGTRTNNECYIKWYRSLDPRLKSGPFTDEELQKLSFLVRKYGPKWSIITREIEGRYDLQCMNAYRMMLKRQSGQHYSLKPKSRQELNDQDNDKNSGEDFEDVKVANG